MRPGSAVHFMRDVSGLQGLLMLAIIAARAFSRFIETGKRSPIFCLVAFSSREVGLTSLENALTPPT